ncbi:MAG: hypothetical protein OXU45_08920 [Candidatus Melainabacteria bacterium]|nr:hypothetical protein [Candidatus Melainabacteria bacterium]
MAILLVGLTADELANHELKLLKGKKIIEVPYTLNWRNTLQNTQADEVLLRQNSGFVGLYTPGGSLVRPVDIEAGNPYSEQNPAPPETVQAPHQAEFSQIGYSTGGRIDPYQPQAYAYEPKDNSKLAAGYGYNPQVEQPKVFKKSSWVDLLNFVPIDAVTPLNYPGTFDQTGIGTAYTLGALPHIGGAVAQWRRAKSEKENFDYYQQQQPPTHSALPPTYHPYNSTDPSNPVSNDPNLIRYQEMPQAFVREYPAFGTTSPGGYYNNP